RHADPRLTMNVYSHVSLYDTGKAVNALPDLFHDPQSPQKKAATGTEGRFDPRHQSDATSQAAPNADNPIVDAVIHKGTFAPHLRLAGDSTGLELATADEMAVSSDGTEANRKPLETTGVDATCRELSRPDSRVGDGIRTRDIQIHNLAP